MKFVDEFKEFALKGNVFDLAVGVIIGGGFGKVVDSLVTDVIMPPIGLVIGKGFTDKYVLLKQGTDGLNSYASLEAAKKAGAVVFAYGSFVTVVLNFLILALAVFAMVKIINRWRRTEAPAPAPPTPTEELLTEIRDELRKK
ncbi:MAG: large conductance mechanosensitive channel protein MscL [Armatimonadota bacterium]